MQGIQHHFEVKNLEALVKQGQEKWEQFVAEHWLPFRESVIALFINSDASKSTSEAEEVVIPQYKEDQDLIQSSMNEKTDDNEPAHTVVEPPVTQQTMYTVAAQDTQENVETKTTVPEPPKKSEK